MRRKNNNKKTTTTKLQYFCVPFCSNNLWHYRFKWGQKCQFLLLVASCLCQKSVPATHCIVLCQTDVLTTHCIVLMSNGLLTNQYISCLCQTDVLTISTAHRVDVKRTFQLPTASCLCQTQISKATEHSWCVCVSIIHRTLTWTTWSLRCVGDLFKYCYYYYYYYYY